MTVCKKNLKNLKKNYCLQFWNVGIVINWRVIGTENLIWRVLIAEKSDVVTCYKFNISKDILLDKADKQTHDYLLNFICDFLNLSSNSIQCYFPNVEIVKKEKVHLKLSYVKSEKNRSQVISVKIPTGKKTVTFQNGRCKRKVFY